MNDSEFATPEVDINTQTVLLHASNNDLVALKPFLRQPGNASVQDRETGYTPLHAAIAACGQAKPKPEDEVVAGQEGQAADEEEVDIEKAKEVVKELFLSGAIWNDLDRNDETPGCMAWRLGQKELYELCVEAGVRAEMLLGLLGGYEPLADEDSEDEELEAQLNGAETQQSTVAENSANGHTVETKEEEKKDLNSEDYLKSDLTFEDDKLLDADANGVMMAWETDIMQQTVELLLPENQPGKRILISVSEWVS
jgi:protein arginine N-methyltransferase 2